MAVAFKLKGKSVAAAKAGRRGHQGVVTAISKKLDKKEDLVTKAFTSHAKFAFKEIKARTPVWRDTGDPNDGWEALRRLRGDVPGKAQRGWKSRTEKEKMSWSMIITNNVEYIQMLEFGGYGDQSVQGPEIFNYAGFPTKRTIPAQGGDVGTNRSNVSRQAPQGMVRIAILSMMESLRKEFGIKGN